MVGRDIFDRPGGGRGAGCWLRKSRGTGGVEGDASLHFLQNLVDMPVEHGDRSEFLERGQRFRAVVGAPAPVREDHPQGYVREDDDRGAAGKVLHVFLEPGQLVRTQQT